MFSKAEKIKISEAVEKILLEIGHPEMPNEKPEFHLNVRGKEVRKEKIKIINLLSVYSKTINANIIAKNVIFINLPCCQQQKKYDG